MIYNDRRGTWKEKEEMARHHNTGERLKSVTVIVVELVHSMFVVVAVVGCDMCTVVAVDVVVGSMYIVVVVVV